MRRLIVLFPLIIATTALSTPAMAEMTAGEAAAFTLEDDAAMSSCLDDMSARPPAECIGEASGFCQEEPGGASTIGIVACLERETSWWDNQLNTHYQTLEADLDAETFEALRDAQRAWIAYRDASCAFAYQYWAEGTMRSIAFGSCMLDETARRALALGEVLDWPS